MTETDMRRLARGGSFPGETARDDRRMPLWPAIAITALLWGGVVLAAMVIGWVP